MSELKDLYVASVGAAAALLGLLFVAVTFAADKASGASADMKKRGAAIGAFIALPISSLSRSPNCCRVTPNLSP